MTRIPRVHGGCFVTTRLLLLSFRREAEYTRIRERKISFKKT